MMNLGKGIIICLVWYLGKRININILILVIGYVYWCLCGCLGENWFVLLLVISIFFSLYILL